MVTYSNFSLSHIPDNEAAYFLMLQSAIASVDSFYYLTITKTPYAYNVRISLTTSNLVNTLISQLNNLNNSLQLRVEYSKSAKKGTLFYKLFLEN